MTGTFPIQNLVDNKDIAVAFICFHFLSHWKETEMYKLIDLLLLIDKLKIFEI